MLRATHSVAGRFVLATLGTTLALTACQAAPGTAPTARRAAPKAPAAADGPVPLAAPMRAEPMVAVRAHAMGAVVVPVAADAPAGVFVSAAAGGTYRSPDGSVEAVIPPGALDRDAVVRFEALPTADLPRYASYLPGIRVAADLGGAAVRPGQAIRVGARLAPETLASLRAADPGADLGALGLVADGAGGMRLSMPVRGPATGPVPAPEAPPASGWSMFEFGGPTVAAAPARALLAAGPKVIAAKMPTTFREFHDLEYAGLIGCDISGTCLNNMVWEHVFDGKPMDPALCGLKFELATPTPGPNPTDTPPPPKVPSSAPTTPPKREPEAFPCRVTWVSDDPRVHGQPAVGARVTFRLPSGPGFGPNEVLADAQGLAATFAPEGWVAFPGATLAPGRPVDEGRAVTVRQGMPPVELKLLKNLPIVALRVASLGGKPLAEALFLDYTVAGKPGSLEIPLVGGDASETMASFTVQIEGDDPSAFVFTGARLADGRDALKLPEPFGVTWNGIYPVRLEFPGEALPQPK